MNAFMNITIRVNSGTASAQMKAFRNQAVATQQVLQRGSAAGFQFGQSMRLTGLERFGKNLQWTGRQIEFNFTLPIVLATAAATKFAFDNEAAMVRVRKVYGEVGGDAVQLRAEVDALGRSFELLSNRFGVHQDEVIGIGAAWAQAGAAGVGLAKAVRQTLELMILGEMDATAATEGLIAMQSAYRLNTEQLADAVAQLNIIENQTSVSLSDLIQGIQKAGGVSVTAGLQIRELAGMMAILVPAGGSGATAGNGLRSMIASLMGPTREATDLLREMGLAIDDTSWHSLNAVQRFQEIARAYETLEQGQRIIVDQAIATKWQLNRFDLLMKDFALTLDEATASQSVFNRVMAITSDSTVYNAAKTHELLAVLRSSPQAFKIFTTQIQNAMAKAILPLLPSLVGLMGAIAKAVDAFANMSDRSRTLAVTFLLLLALVGPIARYIGSFTLLFTTLGRAMLGTVHVLFGMSAAHRAQFTAAELSNMSLMRQHGILGGLVVGIGKYIYALTRIPFRVVAIAGDLLWKSLVLGAQASIGVMRLLWQAVTVLSGPLYRAFAGIASGVGTLMSSTASVIAAGVSRTAAITSRILAIYLGRAASMTGRALAAMKAMWALFGAFTTAIWSGITGALGAIASFMVGIWSRMHVAMAAISRAFGVAWLAISTSIQRAWIIVNHGIGAIWIATQRLILGAAVVTGTLMGKAWLAMQAMWYGVGNAMLRFTIFMTGGMGKAFTMLATFFIHPLHSMRVVWAYTMAFFKVTWAALVAFLGGGWVAVIAGLIVAIGVLAYAFRDKLGGIGKWVVEQFNKLPQGIQGALIAVARMLQSWAMAVKEWLSYLNPFARHSPSLVDNVTRGVSTILNQYSRLAGIRSVIRNAIGALAAFNAATGTAMKGAQLGEYQQAKLEITSIAPGSAGEIDALINSIFEMEDALAQVGSEIAIQEQYVDNWRRSIESAMAPINDAIFENELAQKRLRLEMLRMEEAGESIDDVRDRLSRLNGEIEGMRAERTDLRMAGAGGDVLGFYDQQIDALEAQRDALEGYADPLSELQKQLDELQRAGEIMQLERDLNFDPQLRALEAEEEKLKELEAGYRDIEAAIRDMEGALNSSAAAARQLKAEQLKADEVPFAVEQFRNAEGADFPTFEGDTIPGLGREGGLAEIEEFNRQLEEELAAEMDKLGAMDFFAPFKDMFKSAWTWIKDNVGPYVAPVWNAISSWWGGIDWTTMFGNLRAAWDNLWAGMSGEGDGPAGRLGGILESIGGFVGGAIDWLRMLWDFIMSVLTPVWDWLYETVVGAGKSIGGELQNWGELIDPFIEALGHLVDFFKTYILPTIAVALGAIMVIWKTVWPALRNILSANIDFIVGIIRAGLEIVRGIIGFVLNLINGDWGAAWNSLLTIVDGIWDAIYSVIKFPIDLIIGIVTGLVEGIVDAWDWLYDILVGHSIIPDLMNAIIGWFNFIINPIKIVWDAIWGAIQWAWDKIKGIWNDLKIYWFTTIQPKIQDMQTLFQNVWDGIWTAVSGAWDRIRGVFQTVLDFIRNNFNSVWDTFSSATSAVWNGLKDVIGAALRPVGNLVAGFLRVVASVAGAVGLGGIESTLRSAATSADGWGEGAQGGTLSRSGFDLVNAAGRRKTMNHSDLTPFRTNGPVAIVGEGRSSYPEYVIPTDPAYRKRAQGLLHAAAGDLQMLSIGGMIGGAFNSVVGGASGAVNWAGDQIESVAREAAAGIMRNAWPELLNMSPFSGWGENELKTMFPSSHDSLRNSTIDMIEQEAHKVMRMYDAPMISAKRFAQDQVGKPYVWGASGPNGYDCTGFMSAIANVIEKRSPYVRRLTTGSIWNTAGTGGFKRDAATNFRIGVQYDKQTAAGHAAGTLFMPDGTQFDVESTPNHVRAGFGARGWGYGSQKFGLIGAYARGGVLPGDTGLMKNGMSIPALLQGGGQSWLTMMGDTLAMGVPALFNGGLVKGSRDGTLVRVGDRNRDELVQPLPRDYDGGSKEYHFHGNLEFPNVKNGDDAKSFLRNLETLVGD